MAPIPSGSRGICVCAYEDPQPFDIDPLHALCSAWPPLPHPHPLAVGECISTFIVGNVNFTVSHLCEQRQSLCSWGNCQSKAI